MILLVKLRFFCIFIVLVVVFIIFFFIVIGILLYEVYGDIDWKVIYCGE